MYGYYRKKFHVNHFWELKGLGPNGNHFDQSNQQHLIKKLAELFWSPACFKIPVRSQTGSLYQSVCSHLEMSSALLIACELTNQHKLKAPFTLKVHVYVQ